MHRFPARWTTSLIVAALVSLPLAASAQSTAPPQTTPPPQTAAPAPGQNTKVDSAASKQHLSAARDTLSQLTSMPEAARLQGEARTQVSQIISSFNELITTQADWRSAYAKVDAGLTAVLGPDTPDQPPPAPVSGVTGAVGTAGAAAAAIDPAVRAKLVEFRSHLKEFERAAGGTAPAAMPPSPATDPAVNPANPPAATAPPDQAKAAEQAGHSEADKHLDAISAILNQSKTGALTRAQTAALKKHVAELRMLLSKSVKPGL